MWLAAQQPDWSPQEHARFPPAFKAAARTLLLAARHGARLGGGPDEQSPGEEGAEGALRQLGALPAKALLRVLGVAAYPLSAWATTQAGS